VDTEVPTSLRVESAGASDANDADAIAARMLVLLNEARRAQGAPPVAEDPSLRRLAEEHSRDMIDANYFGHTSPVAGDLAARAKRAACGFPLVAENSARGRAASDMHASLMESPGHRINMLNPDFTHVGIGVIVRGHDGTKEAFASQEFGARPKPLDPEHAPAA